MLDTRDALAVGSLRDENPRYVTSWQRPETRQIRNSI
jgi:hypothetical protein